MNIDAVYTAKERIKPYIYSTPLLYSELLSHQFKKQIWLKLETQQLTGSYKARPAFNSILANLDAARQYGVIASSSGNFAQGVAYAAQQLGVKAMIIMGESTSPFKIQRTKKLGADVILCGDSHEAREETTQQLQKETGRVFLHPYNTFETIAGDGTVGLDLSDQNGNEMDEDMSVLVSVGGGGLVAGIAFTIKYLHPHCKVIAVQSSAGGSLYKSVKAGHCVNVGPFKTIADALVASEPGENSFGVIQKYVDEVVLVDEETIREATGFLIEQHKLVVEPAGALPLAAVMAGKIPTQKATFIISGGNISLWQPQ